MATLAVFPLALLLAALGGTIKDVNANYTSPELTMVVVDGINDIIRNYNNHFRGGPPAIISDVVGKDEVSPENRLHYAFTEGKMFGRSIKFLPAETKVSFEVVRDQDGIEKHILTSLIPITVKGLELRYDRVKVDLVAEKGPINPSFQPIDNSAPQSEGVARAIIGKNKFVAGFKVTHLYPKPGVKEDAQCLYGITDITIEQFEIKRINVTGLDALMDNIINVIVSHLKNKFAEQSFAPLIIEHLIEQRSSVLFPQCHYLQRYPIVC